MADFEKAFAKTVFAEGGYVNNPNDRGGETFMGVARKFHPNSPMWEWVDSYKKQFKGKEFNQKLKECQPVQREVKMIYYNNYWNPLKLNMLNSQRLANQFFDAAVNTGVKTAIKLIQRMANLPETGRMNSKIIKYYVTRYKK